MQPPALVWDKSAMNSLLNAVRAECLGEVTLNPVQDGGYLSRLVARVKSPAFQPTDGQISMKLFEWHATYGGDQEAFERCEMAVQRTDAAKRHEDIWASQAASVSRSAVGENEAQVKRVPRLNFQDRASTLASNDAAPASQTTPSAARRLSGAGTTKVKKRTTVEDAAKGNGKEAATQGEFDAGDQASGRRTRRKLLPEYPSEGCAASPQDPKGKGAALDANETPSPEAPASRAQTAEKKTSRLSDPLKASAHCDDAEGSASSRSRSRNSVAGTSRPGSGSGSFKAGTSRRLAWATAGRGAAEVDPNTGVQGFLRRARTALRDAGGADRYAQANSSGANGRAVLSEILAERMLGREDGGERCSEPAEGNTAKAKVSLFLPCHASP